MEMLSKLNNPVLYLICGGIVLIIAAICVIFLVRAWRAGKALGMDTVKMKRAITSSATFSLLPSVGTLLGVLALSGSLGIPWPWLRLSVIGALAFSTIALLMSVCIMWGMILTTIFNRKYVKKLQGKDPEKKTGGGFGDLAMIAMFIGMVSAYLGSYLGGFVSGNGRFTFSGDWTPLLVAAVAALAMAGFTWLAEQTHWEWLDNFSIAGSMLLGMLSAVLVGN